MDRKIQIDSPQAPQVPIPPAQLPVDVWEPPFERWMRLADDLLRDWPHSTRIKPERRI